MTERIAAVRVRILRAPVAEPIRMSFGVLDARRMALIEIESHGGLVGYGESWINYPPWAAAERVATIRHGVAPLLVDRDLVGVRALVTEAGRRLLPMGVQWGAPGPIYQALSGVEIALYDLFGKVHGLAVAELLGGRVRTEVPVYASGLSPDTAARLARACGDAGFSAVKCRVGFGLDKDTSAVDTVREVLGADARIFVDANQAWSLREAVEAVRELARHGVAWFEEPIAGNRLDDLEALYGRTGACIALGENTYGLDTFATLVRSPAIGVLQPDVSKVGGIGELDLICSLADSRRTAVLPHWYGGPVALAATVQVAAAAPAAELVEFDIRENPLRDTLLADPVRPTAGALPVPKGPGLGIELDADAVAEYEEVSS